MDGDGIHVFAMEDAEQLFDHKLHDAQAENFKCILWHRSTPQASTRHDAGNRNYSERAE
jgi:hypothetical protein